jgi:hypothetical protein
MLQVAPSPPRVFLSRTPSALVAQRRVVTLRRRDRPTVCAVRMVEAVELVACHVFSLADCEGQPICMEQLARS